MNIDELTGEELDRVVHEKVFGLKAPGRHVCGCVDYAYAVIEKGLPLCPACEQRGDPLARAVEPYSTNLERAWEVVEAVRLKYREGMCSVTVSRTAAGNPTARYWCSIMERIYDEHGWHNSDKYTVDAEAETAPLAICRAALKAMEKQ